MTPSNQNRPPSRAERRAPPARGDNRLLYGVHAVAHAWANPRRRCHALWATRGGLDALAATNLPAGPDRPAPRLVDRGELERRLPPGSVHQGLLLEADPLPDPGIEWLAKRIAAAPRAIALMLDQVTDPHNVGAALRSAAAFGALGLVVQERHAPPITGALAKTASGALEHVPLIRATNLARAIRKLQDAGVFAVGLAEEGDHSLHAIAPAPRTLLVLGAEGEGLRRLTRESCDTLARLPTEGPIASLNVSNAAAIALYAIVTAGKDRGDGAAPR